MNLLITTLTLIFISFNSFAYVEYEVENRGGGYCYNALMKGEILSHDVKESTYTVRWLNNIYNFMAGFTGNSFMVSNCQRIKKKN